MVLNPDVDYALPFFLIFQIYKYTGGKDRLIYRDQSSSEGLGVFLQDLDDF